MAYRLTVRPELGLMFVRFSGAVSASEAIQAFERYAAHPDFAAGQKHLIDFTDVTAFTGDYTGLMQLMAKLAATATDRAPALYVYCAPTPLTRRMAQHAVNAWSATDRAVVRVLNTEKEALDVVGLPAHDFDTLDTSTA